MNWFLLALAAPLAWSIANYIDKYVLSSAEGSDAISGGGLFVLSSIIGLIVPLCIFFAHGWVSLDLGSNTVGALILSGGFEALYLLFYFWALEKTSTTTVISLAQLSPIMGLIFGYALIREAPTGMQFAAVLVILAGTLCIVLKKGSRFTWNSVVPLMVASTAFIGLYNTLFKLAAEGVPFWSAVFWQYVGVGIVGFIVFVTVDSYRREAVNILTKRKGTKLVATFVAEGMNVLALLATNAAILLAPIALVLSVSSVQPIFVLLEGILLASIFPAMFGSEKTVFRAQYIVGILLVCIGGVLIYIK